MRKETRSQWSEAKTSVMGSDHLVLEFYTQKREKRLKGKILSWIGRTFQNVLNILGPTQSRTVAR